MRAVITARNSVAGTRTDRGVILQLGMVPFLIHTYTVSLVTPMRSATSRGESSTQSSITWFPRLRSRDAYRDGPRTGTKTESIFMGFENRPITRLSQGTDELCAKWLLFSISFLRGSRIQAASSGDSERGASATTPALQGRDRVLTVLPLNLSGNEIRDRALCAGLLVLIHVHHQRHNRFVPTVRPDFLQPK